jgi:hypothetical protein
MINGLISSSGVLGFWGFGVLGMWGFGKHIPSSLKLKTHPISQVILEIPIILFEINKDVNSEKQRYHLEIHRSLA